MSKVKKYLGMISILLAFNLITFFISFLFFEYSETANMIINYSSIVCFFVLCFLLSFYIAKKFEKSLLPLSVCFVCITCVYKAYNGSVSGECYKQYFYDARLEQFLAY